ncbi:hypothetical protein OHA74_54550 [Streptomyces phaeochromogenes]|uniref:hypothetical protein n=1 Tax=Streptomyces phaeochromogenes TaxID=1923 RepID=UPI002E27ABCD|nr:hypothetical protein [Streptomyces phaeochromogenes]
MPRVRSHLRMIGERDDVEPVWMTGRAVVDRIITDLAVIDVTDDGLVLRELAPGVTFGQVQRVPNRL